MRTIHRFAGLLLVLGTGGCNEHPLEAFDASVAAAERQTRTLTARTPIDLLFVIDNSGSMCQEQASLARNFRALADFFFERLGATADLRLAVTSTDVEGSLGAAGRFVAEPALPAPMRNCLDPETDEPVVPDTADCAELVDRGALPAVLALGAEGNVGLDCNEADATAQAACVRADLERKFRCLATLGTQGTNREMGLEAMRLALDCKGPNAARFGACCEDGVYNPACRPPPEAAPEFLRPEALLVVVIVSDEDDCSFPAVNPGASDLAICRHGIADRDADGVPDGFLDPELCADRPELCFAHECGLLDGHDCFAARCEVSSSVLEACAWEQDALTPVADYARALFRLKARPQEQLLFAAIVGERLYTPSGAEVHWREGQPSSLGDACDPARTADLASLTSDACCPDGKCLGRPLPSCTSEFGQAFPGGRYLELAEAMAKVGQACLSPATSLCDGDLQGPLDELATCVEVSLSAWCLDKPPVCHLVDADGASVPCDAEQATDPVNYPLRISFECTDPTACEAIIPRQLLPADSYSLELGAGCPGGARVLIDAPLPAGATVSLEYLVAAGN